MRRRVIIVVVGVLVVGFVSGICRGVVLCVVVGVIIRTRVVVEVDELMIVNHG